MKSSKKINVDIYQLKKVLKENIELELPLEKFFYQKFNYRIIIGVFPMFVDDDLFEYKIIKITDESIINCELNVSANNLSQLFLNLEMRDTTQVQKLLNEVVLVLKNKTVDYISEQTFINYYKEHLQKFKDVLNYSIEL